MELNIVECQSGFDYDIFGLTPNMMIQIINKLDILVSNNYKKKIYIGLSLIDHVSTFKDFSKIVPEISNIKLECENNLLILNYNISNIEKIISILSDIEKIDIIQHIFFLIIKKLFLNG